MSIDDYIHLLSHPETLQKTNIEDLKTILANNPYCTTTRMMLLKAMHNSQSIHYTREIPHTVVYAHSPRALYTYIHHQDQPKERTNTRGDYFDMMHTIEGISNKSGETLQELAAKLKQARQQLITDSRPKAEPTPKSPEQQAKKLIKERKYDEALVILRQIASNSEDKKEYIEDQIRFLEKIR